MERRSSKACLSGVDHSKGVVGRLHEDLQRPVAAESPTPDRLVVGGKVEVDQAGALAGHHFLGFPFDVVVQAAAADVADEVAALGDEQTGAGPAVGGTTGSHDGGQSHLLSPSAHLLDGAQDIHQLTHPASNPRQVSTTTLGASTTQFFHQPPVRGWHPNSRPL